MGRRDTHSKIEPVFRCKLFENLHIQFVRWLLQKLEQTESFAFVFRMNLWLYADASAFQIFDVGVGKKFAILFDNGHHAVVCAQKGQKLDVVLARLGHVGKYNAIVVLRNDGNFDGGNCRSK